MLPGMCILLDPKTDRDQNIYHVGRIQGPAKLNFKEGVIFLAFLSEEGDEELKISCAKPGSICDTVRRKMDDGTVERYVIALQRREDYYMALVQDDNLELDLKDGYVFFVFTSSEGSEQLHIMKNRGFAKGRDDEKQEVISMRHRVYRQNA